MSNVRLLSSSDETLQLKTAVLLYESGRGSVYATTHIVEVDAEMPSRSIISAGTPMSRASLSKFAKAVEAATAYAGFVPENLLYTAPNMMAWWAPAVVRKTWFKGDDGGIGNHDGLAAHPALVFVAQPHSWHVFALRDSVRPDLSTPLFHSPHFNVSPDGRICVGNIKMPAAPSSDAIGQYEDAFYRSHFTHPNHAGAVKYRGGMRQLWLDQLENADAVAMRRALKQAKATLKTAIERIASSNRNEI
ncbi:PRTRC system protein B [Duganella aceris]|uniref:PRTRC system protein B n=1 Tax=Duganella aceris TaxID=2703883 RepID=A0ABX0FP82_9BURK|nr:PRTRC system protein B [Duganella aceris]NGZ86439.1 PRTRC system protein B [Duganella aceris]